MVAELISREPEGHQDAPLGTNSNGIWLAVLRAEHRARSEQIDATSLVVLNPYSAFRERARYTGNLQVPRRNENGGEALAPDLPVPTNPLLHAARVASGIIERWFVTFLSVLLVIAALGALVEAIGQTYGLLQYIIFVAPVVVILGTAVIVARRRNAS